MFLIRKIKNWITDKKNLVALACFLGFLITSASVPFLYLNASAGNTKQTIKESRVSPFGNLDIKAKSVAVYDATTGKFIYTKNGNAQLPLASITKVMTSVSALRIAEKMDTNRPIKFSGNWWNPADLMRYALVSSSNSGVTSIAEAMSRVENKQSGAIDTIDFVGEMNSIAKELHLKTTYFLNETGLDVNTTLGGAYGSAKDMTRLFSHATERYPHIFGATKYPEIKIYSEEGANIYSKNTNIDAEKMTTLIASKTGTTDLAGGNLVIAFDAGVSHPIIICILGSTPEDRFSDVEKLSSATIDYLASK